MFCTVHKFGGSVLYSKNGFLNMCNFIKKSTSKNIVIISAIGRTSFKLKTTLDFAEISETEKSISLLDDIFDDHKSLASQCLVDTDFKKYLSILNKYYENCINIINSISITGEVTGKTYDRFVAVGEDLILSLIETYYWSDSLTITLDSRKIIKTNSNFKHANPIYFEISSKINQTLEPLLKEYKNVFMQGFVGSDDIGNTTTMGFESSNLTATIIAKFLNVSEITIWTDVDGVYTCDPDVINLKSPISHIHFENSLIASYEGLKLFYPEMLNLALEKNISVKYRNGLVLSENFTLIDNNNDFNPVLIVINYLNILSNSSKFHEDQKVLSILESNEIKHFSKSNDSNDNRIIKFSIINGKKNKILRLLTDNFAELLDSSKLFIFSGINEKCFYVFLYGSDSSKIVVNNLLEKLLEISN